MSAANTLDAIAVHPDVAAWLETAGMLTYTNVTDTSNAASSIWGSGGIGLSSTQVALFAGLRVVVDEQLPVICNPDGPANITAIFSVTVLCGLVSSSR